MGVVTFLGCWNFFFYSPTSHFRNSSRRSQSFTILENPNGAVGITVTAFKKETLLSVILCLPLTYSVQAYVISISPCSAIVCEKFAWVYRCLTLLSHSFCSPGNKMMPWGHGHLCFFSEVLLLSGSYVVTSSPSSSSASSCHRELYGSSSSSWKMLSLPTSCRQGHFGGLLRNCASSVSDWWLMRKAALCLKDQSQQIASRWC